MADFTLNPTLKLDETAFTDKASKAATREGWGKALLGLGGQNPQVMALSADVSGSVCTEYFEKAYPERFVQCGVAEQNMAAVAAGMALEGKQVFFSAFAVFSPGRNFDQIRVTIAYNNLDVKFSGAHAGVTVGQDGATHQALEDIAMMRVLPNVAVLVPADSRQAGKAVFAAAARPGPVYIRLGREKVPTFTTDETPFEIGKINVLCEGSDVAIVAAGVCVFEALKAAKRLAAEGISASVLDCHTIKPIDRETLMEYAAKCGCVVTAEEHQVNGGLGGAVAEVLSEECPTPLVRVGMPDRFGESGGGLELLKHFGMGEDGIWMAAKEAMGKKRG